MNGITIVSGSPGSGKTTLARSLAESAAQGLHLQSDDFYRYPGRPIDPTRVESRAQNETIMRALARAASAFVEGGYEVYVDGVIGPWMLPVFAAELDASVSLEYVALRSDLELALVRVRERQGAGASAAVAHMHAAFSDLGACERTALDTTGKSAGSVLGEFNARRGRGEFRLEASMWAPEE